MAIKFSCTCGVPVIVLTKQAGEAMTCRNCGRELIIPEESTNTKGVISTKKSQSEFTSQIKTTQKISSQAPSVQTKSAPPAIKKTKSNPLTKCPKCSKTSKADAILCIECGTSLRTGKTHYAAPQNQKKKGLFKNEYIKLIAALIIVFIIAGLGFLYVPKGIDFCENAFSDMPVKFVADGNQIKEKVSPVNQSSGTKTTGIKEKKKRKAEFSEADLDYDLLDEQDRVEIKNKVLREAHQKFLKRYPVENNIFKYYDKGWALYGGYHIDKYSNKKVKFKTIKGLTITGWTFMNNSTNKNQVTIKQNLAQSKTLVFKREEIDPDDRYLFFMKDRNKKVEEYVSKHVKHPKKQSADFDKIVEQVDEKIYIEEGYGWSKKNKQWIPAHGPIIAETIEFTPIIKAINKLSSTDSNLPIKEADISVSTSISKIPYVKISIRILMPKDYKRSIYTEIYRSKEKNGKYKLINREKFKFYSRNAKYKYAIFHASAKDKSSIAEKSNNVYYRVHICQDDYYREFAPLKVPIILPVKSEGQSWTWNPVNPDGDPIDVRIFEYIKIGTTKFYTFVSSLDKEIVHKKNSIPKNLKLCLEITPKLMDIGMCSNDNGIVTKKTVVIRKNDLILQKGDAKKIPGIIPKFKYSGTIYQTSGSSVIFNADKIMLNGKSVSYPKPGTKFSNRSGGFNDFGYGTFFSYSGSGSSIRKKKYNISNKLVKIYLNVSDRKTKKKVAAPVITFRTLPVVPKMMVKILPNGNLISWKKIEVERNDYVIIPKLVIKSSKGIVYSGDIDSNITKVLDTAVTKGEMKRYYINLEDGVIKTQGWIKGLGTKDLIAPVNHFSGMRNYETDIISIADSRKLFSKAIDDELLNSAVDENELEKNIPPLRIGIWEPDMCHEYTGFIELELIDKITNVFLNKKEYVVFNRFNKRALLNEKSLQKLYATTNKQYKYGLDFIIRLRDFSREEGNGVEVWLTQLGAVSDEEAEWENFYPAPNLESSWRIGTILYGKKKVNLDDRIIKPLLAKIKALTKAKRSPAKYKTYNPKNIVFDFIRPIEGKKQVWQYKDISESIMLELGEKMPNHNILSRDNWLILLNEQKALLNQKIKTDIILGDIALTGNIWSLNDAFGSLIFASDIKTGVLLASLSSNGNPEKIATDISEWVVHLQKPILAPPSLYIGNNYLLNLERGIRAFDRFVHVKKYKIFKKEDILSNKSFVRRRANFIKNNSKKNQSTQSLKEISDAKINLNLAKKYHNLGLYGSEIKVYQFLCTKPNAANKAELLKKMERAKLLAKKTSLLLKLTVSKSRKQKREKLNIEDPIPEGSTGSVSYRENQNLNEVLHCARNQIGQEWNSSGQIMTNNFFCISDISSYKKYLKNEYGAWEKVKISKSRNRKSELQFWIHSWQSISPFSKIRKLMYPKSQIIINEKGEVDKLRNAIAFSKNPYSRILYNGNFKSTCKDFLAKRSYNLKNIKSQDELYIDFLFKTDLYSKFNSGAKKAIEFAMKQDVSLDEINKKSALLIFQAYKGKKKAISTIINYLKKNNSSDFTKKTSIFLFALSGREKILKVLLSKMKANADGLNYIRWGKKDTIKRLIGSIKLPEKSRYYLIDGFSFTTKTHNLLNEDSEKANNTLVLLHGKPIEEIKNEYGFAGK